MHPPEKFPGRCTHVLANPVMIINEALPGPFQRHRRKLGGSSSPVGCYDTSREIFPMNND